MDNKELMEKVMETTLGVAQQEEHLPMIFVNDPADDQIPCYPLPSDKAVWKPLISTMLEVVKPLSYVFVAEGYMAFQEGDHAAATKTMNEMVQNDIRVRDIPGRDEALMVWMVPRTGDITVASAIIHEGAEDRGLDSWKWTIQIFARTGTVQSRIIPTEEW